MTAFDRSGHFLVLAAIAAELSIGLAGQTLPGRGRILGQLTDAATGQPVRGATVFLTDFGLPKLQTIADDNGTFTLDAVPPGSYSLSAQLEGYWGCQFGQESPYGSWQMFDLLEGEHVTGVVLRVWKLASIRGTVLRESGQPALGLFVQALSRRVVDGRTSFTVASRPAITDQYGRFALVGLVPGDYIVAASASRHGGSTDPGAIGMFPTTYYPGVTEPEAAAPLTVRPGEAVEDIKIHFLSSGGYQVSGHLMSLPPVVVSLHLTPVDASNRLSALSMLSTTAAPDGRFVFVNVPPGRYSITTVAIPPANRVPDETALIQEIVAHGQTFAFPAGDRGFPLARAPEAPTYWTDTRIAVENRDVTDLAVSLQSGVQISGRIDFDGSGTAASANQLRRTPVIVLESDRQDLGSFPTGTIEADGSFRLVSLPSGRYSIAVLPLFDGGTRGWMTQRIQQGLREVTGTPIVLGSDHVDDVTITLTNHPTQISGLIRDASGNLASQARVYVFPVDRGRWAELDMGEHWPRLIRPARSGKYTVSLAPGSYLFAALDGHPPDPLLSSFERDRIAELATLIVVGAENSRSVDLTARRFQ